MLTAAEASGVCANRCCNPAQGKYWHTFGEPLQVYLLRIIAKPFPVALALGGRAGVHWVSCWACTLCWQKFTLALPSIYSVLQLLAELPLKDHRVSMSQVLTRSRQTLLGTVLVSQLNIHAELCTKYGLVLSPFPWPLPFHSVHTALGAINPPWK